MRLRRPQPLAVLLCALAPLNVSTALLSPPRVIASTGRTVQLLVPIADGLSVVLLEANVAAQQQLVDAALDSDLPAGTSIDDPYGVVLWPAAQVVANAVAAIDIAGKSVLELGAGTGLVSIVAAACGASVLATDYREEPLELLCASAARTAEHIGVELQIETAVIDIKDSNPLPNATLVVAADVLYQLSTSIALARRCAEALRTPGCEGVIIGDLGRPGRQAFLDELKACGVAASAAQFQQMDSWTAGTGRHELVSTDDEAPRSVSVGLMHLKPSDLVG